MMSRYLSAIEGAQTYQMRAPQRRGLIAFGLTCCLALFLAAGCGKADPPGAPTGTKESPVKPGSASAPTDSEEQVGGNTRIERFRSAKPHVMAIFKDHRETFYCGCRFSDDKVVDLESCGYQWRKNEKRARRMEVEHVVPAEAFGKSFLAWREGHPDCVTKKGKAYKGRRCAKKVSQLFRRMEADIHNLQPSIGEVNGDRSNYSMEEIPGEVREYGACDVEIDGRKIEPKEAIRGDIARIYFYMDKAYPNRGIVGHKRRRILTAWDAQDPIDDWERTRAKRIADIQGNATPFVSQ